MLQPCHWCWSRGGVELRLATTRPPLLLAGGIGRQREGDEETSMTAAKARDGGATSNKRCGWEESGAMMVVMASGAMVADPGTITMAALGTTTTVALGATTAAVASTNDSVRSRYDDGDGFWHDDNGGGSGGGDGGGFGI
uniref:Uncharacterized protein n=1 Tax=Oryza sativa subsp. japonica TaxID=39947 RepID=Q6ENZ2_ORYSJ|nr:hypothetical protein [Oryza sativa Japonica Group]